MTEEESEKEQKLNVYIDEDENGRLASQRDRSRDLDGFKIASEVVEEGSGEKDCSEIRLSFFSPTKLTDCFVKKRQEAPSTRSTERFNGAIEKNARDIKSHKESSLSFRQQLDARFQQRNPDK